MTPLLSGIKTEVNGNKLIQYYFRLSLPVVLSSIVAIVYNLADTYFIAQTGNALLVAGVSVCTPIFVILMAFGNIFGQGGSSLLSRLLGQERLEEAGRVSAYCFWIAIATGAVIGGLLLILKEPFLILLGSSSDTIPYAREYATVLLIGAPLIVVNFIHMNLLRCEGMATIAMVGTVIGAVVNIILDPIMISCLGAAGAAVASVTGYACSDFFLLFIAVRFSEVISVRPLLSIEAYFGRDIISIGVTAAITNIASSLCTILINHKLLAYGDDKIAAMGIVLKVTMIVHMFLVGFSFGGVPLFGFLTGAGEYQKIHKLLRFCIIFLCTLAMTLTIIVWLMAEPLLHRITPDTSLVMTGVSMLRWLVSGSVFSGIVLLMTCVCQASGKALPALILSLSRQGVVFYIVLMIMVLFFGYQGILMSQCTADFLSALLAIFIFRNQFVKGFEKPEFEDKTTNAKL